MHNYPMNTHTLQKWVEMVDGLCINEVPLKIHFGLSIAMVMVIVSAFNCNSS